MEEADRECALIQFEPHRLDARPVVALTRVPVGSSPRTGVEEQYGMGRGVMSIVVSVIFLIRPGLIAVM